MIINIIQEGKLELLGNWLSYYEFYYNKNDGSLYYLLV